MHAETRTVKPQSCFECVVLFDMLPCLDRNSDGGWPSNTFTHPANLFLLRLRLVWDLNSSGPSGSFPK